MLVHESLTHTCQKFHHPQLSWRAATGFESSVYADWGSPLQTSPCTTQDCDLAYWSYASLVSKVGVTRCPQVELKRKNVPTFQSFSCFSEHTVSEMQTDRKIDCQKLCYKHHFKYSTVILQYKRSSLFTIGVIWGVLVYMMVPSGQTERGMALFTFTQTICSYKDWTVNPQCPLVSICY